MPPSFQVYAAGPGGSGSTGKQARRHGGPNCRLSLAGDLEGQQLVPWAPARNQGLAGFVGDVFSRLLIS